MSGKLYIVGTPIGNLGDFSPRGKEVLSAVDFIAAEDTRVTAKLLNHFGIKKPLVSYYEHNKTQKGNEIIRRLLSGENAAIVTDAGMPVISDPGEDLVKSAHDNGIATESVPGPSALITALAVSGIAGARFCFEGFLSVNRQERKKHLDSLVLEERTMIFYEAPHKLRATLFDFYETFGDREIAVIKELTKIHETVFRTTLKGAVDYFAQNEPKGEYVLVLSGCSRQRQTYTIEQAALLAKKAIEQGSSASNAAKEAAKITGLKKGDIYKAVLEDN